MKIKYRLIITTLLLNFGLICQFTLPVSANSLPSKPLIQFKKSISLGLPIQCQINTNCWIMNYVDFNHDDGQKTDPNCNKRTYDTHKGTDFALLDEQAMIKGVPVLSTMDGIVVRFRDGEPDNWKTDDDIEQIKQQRKECGNAILIDNLDGNKSIYCHLRQNSINVKQGQRVKRGDKIGLVGMSGMTQFPHLHYGLIQNNQVVDPFTGKNASQKCGLESPKPLWDEDLMLTYSPVTIKALGFTNNVPSLDSLGKNASSIDKLTLQDNKIVFWSILLGVRVDDQITLTITDPNNKVFSEQNITQDKDRARQLYFIGKNLKTTKLIEGAYTGKITITRQTENAPEIKDFKLNTILVTSQ